MKTNKIIKQHNLLTQAKYDMSVYQLNILFLLLAQLGNKKESFYHVSITELEKRLGKPVNLGRLKEATQKLRTQEYGVEKEDGSYLQVGVLASAEYIAGERILVLELSKRMEMYLFDLKDNFTLYELQTALKLNSKYSKRLYPILCQFRSSGIYRTTLTELRDKFEIQDKYSGVSMFKRKVLDVAQKELKGTDISFTYEISRVGKKMEKIEFRIKSTKKPTSKNTSERTSQTINITPTPSQEVPKHKDEIIQPGKRTLFERMTKDFNLSEKHISTIFNNFTVKEINSILYHLKLDFKDKNVKNKQAYTLNRFKMENGSFNV